MSSDENSNETEESGNKAKAASNVLAKILEIKESNPKVFFGAIGALVLVILILMMSGGGPEKSLSTLKAANISVGQTYTLRSVNTYDPDSPVRLVAVPGSMAAYDDTEADDRVGGCKHLPQGTKVKAVQVQEAFQGARFIQVEMFDGECAGQKGWTLSTNLK